MVPKRCHNLVADPDDISFQQFASTTPRYVFDDRGTIYVYRDGYLHSTVG